MSQEENLLILKMLQEGTITAEQAAELLHALDSGAARTKPTPPAPPAPPAPPVPAAPPASDSVAVGTAPDSVAVGTASEMPRLSESDDTLGDSSDLFNRARAKIAAARESASLDTPVDGPAPPAAPAEPAVPAAPPAPEPPLTTGDALEEEARTGAEAGKQPGAERPWETLTRSLKDLKDLPATRSVLDALKGMEASPAVENARRQARRVSRTVLSRLEEMEIVPVAEQRGEPALTVAREATANAAAGTTLRVRNPLGGIEAAGADVPEVRIAGTLRVWAATPEAAQALADGVKIDVQESPTGPVVAVIGPADNRGVVLDLKVFVPRGVTLSLFTPSGKVSSRDFRGGIAVATQSGAVTLREIGGNVAVETVSAPIVLEGIAGDISAGSASGSIGIQRASGNNLKAVTQSGSVEIADVTTSRVEVDTVSGAVDARAVAGDVLRIRTVSGGATAADNATARETRLETVGGAVKLSPRAPLRAGDIAVTAVSGTISLLLPAETDAAMTLSSKNGEIQGRWRAAGEEKQAEARGMHTFEESIGTGAGARMTVSTVSGDIEVVQAEAGA